MSGPGVDPFAVFVPSVYPGSVPGSERVPGDPGHLADAGGAQGFVAPALAVIEVDPAAVLRDEEFGAVALDDTHGTRAQRLVPVAGFVEHIHPASARLHARDYVCSHHNGNGYQKNIQKPSHTPANIIILADSPSPECCSQAGCRCRGRLHPSFHYD